MKNLTEELINAWDNRNGPVIFSTVDKKGMPNAIYATCVKLYEQNRIVIADNYFSKTRNNIASGTKGSILFITGDRKAYQIKGLIKYYKEGEIFDDMKNWLDPRFPGHAATVLHIEEVYSGSERLL